MEQNDDLFSIEVLQDLGVDALGAAGTSCSNNSSNGNTVGDIEQ